jgi:hypothetical protein
MGIDESGSIAIATDGAMFPNEWNEAWVKRWLHGVHMSRSESGRQS